jgi:hypothetical protein
MPNIQAIHGINLTPQDRRREEKIQKQKAQREKEFYFEGT